MSSADILRTPGLPQALADGADALDQVPQLDATITGLQTSLTAAAAQHEADLQTIAALQAQLAKYRPSTQFGINIPRGKLAAFEKLIGGTAAAVRFYHPQVAAGKHATVRWPTAAELGGDLGDRTLVYSAKPWPQDVLAGKYDADWTALCQAAPTDRETYLDPWHEAEDDVEAGLFTAAQHSAAFDRLAGIAEGVGPHLVMTSIAMNATFHGDKGRRWQDYVPDSAKAVGVDAYAGGTIGMSVAQIPTLLDAALAAAGGRPLVVGECAVGQKVTGPARVDAWLALVKVLKQATVACFYVGDTNTNQWKIDAAVTSALSTALAS